MATHSLDIAAFRAQFQAFADVSVYPDATLEVFWTAGTTFLGSADGCLLAGDPLQQALNYMTAHVLALSDTANSGGAPGPVTSSTIDKVSVDFAPPPFRNSGWRYWLAQTPYGQALWALLTLKSAGGFYYGGNPERSSFRRVGGGFGPFGR